MGRACVGSKGKKADAESRGLVSEDMYAKSE